MANTDIKLMDDGDGWVKVEAGDLNVDGGTPRRKGSQTTYKRALVHDFNDGLTINWANDYTGGVTINGVKTIGGQGQVTEFSDRVNFKAFIDCYSRVRFVAAGWSSDIYTDADHNLVVENKPFLGMPPRHAIFNTPVDFQGPVKLKKRLAPGGPNLPPTLVEIADLVDELLRLKNDVAALKQQAGIA